MTDWKLAAQARCPDIPADEVNRIVPVLETLETAFAPLAARLPVDAQPAAFSVEPGEGA